MSNVKKMSYIVNNNKIDFEIKEIGFIMPKIQAELKNGTKVKIIADPNMAVMFSILVDMFPELLTIQESLTTRTGKLSDTIEKIRNLYPLGSTPAIDDEMELEFKEIIATGEKFKELFKNFATKNGLDNKIKYGIYIGNHSSRIDQK